MQELLDVEYHLKLVENKKLAEEATAKKRAKRLKKKQGRKQKKQMKTTKKSTVADERHSEGDSSDENENEDGDEDEDEDEETRTVETNEEYEDDTKNVQNCPENTPTVEGESSATDESQENISKVSIEITNENSQCKNGT